MKTHPTLPYIYEPQTRTAMESVPANTVAAQSMQLGADNYEPLIIILDSALAYAKAYRNRFGRPVGDDYVLGEHLGQVLSGVRGLLNGDGAVAMRKGITTDSKDNSALESLYWETCRFAGLDGDKI